MGTTQNRTQTVRSRRNEDMRCLRLLLCPNCVRLSERENLYVRSTKFDVEQFEQLKLLLF
ncbi:hypothetical protein T4A_7583 [Trichinella pseudospiralis]|uniref:Uncharacterized protein n=1 Tax=Trichinella pseudospiralis TaxID=6337 RepID=A0A0V1E2F6_TRIPS|nr:hypothetical protein T4A_7583 [Trichinella pseudospiralis]